jgi:putative ABC transport system permease protein
MHVQEMLTVDGSSLFIDGGGTVPEENSIMDISFVVQNESFDWLLDLDNQVIDLAPGEVGVPIYYLQRYDLELGDPLRVGEATFSIAAFVRDAQMNPAVVHSKRFLVHPEDYRRLAEHFHEVEYLIEVLLNDLDRLGEFSAAYLAADLPQRGPTVDIQLFKIMNGLTDGIASAVIIVLSLLLMGIAMLCLRFTLLATIEEDYREIGVMKAIGLARRDIRNVYLVKYLVLGASAALLGYLVSLALNPILTSNITLSFGSAPAPGLLRAIPLGAAGFVFLIVIAASTMILRRFHCISAVEALRSGSAGETPRSGRFLPLWKSRFLDLNVFLGLRDVVQRFRLFAILVLIFFFCAFIIIIPVHFLGTIQSPSFVSYLGIGRSDMRVDLRQSEEIAERFPEVVSAIREDPDVERFSPLVTSRFTLVHENGEQEPIAIETGDFSLFPLDYMHGTAPRRDDEIAISYLYARDMDRGPGDTLVLLIEGEQREMTVSGIYQDVTNGGRTAKARLPFDNENVLWYTVSLDLVPGTPLEAKMHQYSRAFYPARVTDLEGYIAQTLGGTIEQLRRVTIIAVAVGLAVAILITALFLKMLIARDITRIGIMRSLGFSLRSIRAQYLTMTLSLLAVGIVAGTVFSNTLGQRLVSVFWSFMGAARIRFVIDPLQAYLLLPLLLVTAVSVTTVAGISRIKQINGGIQ